MNEKHKDEFSGTDQKFSELGQQAGAMLGQLFAAAEQFGQQVSKESQAWSESRASRGTSQGTKQEQDPFVSALRQAGEEFRATANRAAESLSDSFRNNPGDSDDNVDASVDAEPVDPVSGNDINPGNVRKIGGGAVDTAGRPSEHNSSYSSVKNEEPSTDGVTTHSSLHRAEQLAEIFHADHRLADLTADEFDALKTLLEKHYLSVREFQSRK